MKKNTARTLFLAATAAMLCAACAQPKWAKYKSVLGDFTAEVPWGWSVVADAQGSDFGQINFIGPFDPDFYLGAPSLSVRWYRNYRVHRLRNGRLEMYSGADEFIAKTLHEVYGNNALIYGAGKREEDNGRAVVDKAADVPEITLAGSGLTAKYFAVVSIARAPAQNQWGVVVEEDHKYNKRYHEYAVVPVEDGFYVLCYPATMDGHDRHMDAFRRLLGTFWPLTAGPGGVKVRVPGPRAAKGTS